MEKIKSLTTRNRTWAFQSVCHGNIDTFRKLEWILKASKLPEGNNALHDVRQAQHAGRTTTGQTVMNIRSTTKAGISPFAFQLPVECHVFRVAFSKRAVRHSAGPFCESQRGLLCGPRSTKLRCGSDRHFILRRQTRFPAIAFSPLSK
jgi:hypothetical protein